MRWELGGGLVVLGLVLYGPVLTALTLPPAHRTEASYEGATSADADRDAALLDELQAWWRSRIGTNYREADVAFFEDRLDGATGPGYVAPLERVNVDRGFLRELATVYGVPRASSAQTYVLAHAMSHHVERLLGVSLDARGQELVADCLTGVWARARGVLDVKDAADAIAEATTVARDRAARVEATGPEPWRAAPTADRVAWFSRGRGAATLEACAYSGSAAGSESSAPVKRARK